MGVKDVRTGGQGEPQWEDGKAGYIWAEMDFPGNKSAKDVLIRFGKGSILQAQVFATYEARNDSPLSVTYGWTENGQAKESSHEIKGGAASDAWTIETGQNLKTQWVKFEAR
jgi:hypothetical protein